MIKPVKKIILIIFVLFLIPSICLGSEDEKALNLQPQDRVLIIAPHPDDEVISTAGIIQRAVQLRIPLKIVYLTQGDYNELAFIMFSKSLLISRKKVLAMGELRRQESIHAMKVLGVGQENLIFLGYPDFGTLSIFSQYWGTKKPYKAIFTRANKVPYPNTLSFGASYVGENILSDLKKVLLNFQPTKIFVSHPSDAHPDHRAAYLFLKVALWDVGPRLEQWPELFPYLTHISQWPKPKGFKPQLMLAPPDRLKTSVREWYTFNLTPQEIRKKKEALSVYKTQLSYSSGYLFSFVRKNELFGDFSTINLSDNGSPDIDWEKLNSQQNLVSPVEGKRPLTFRSRSVVFARQGDALMIRVVSKKFTQLGQIPGLQLELYGYKQGVSFGDLPKYDIQFLHNKTVVIFDRKKLIFIDGVSVAWDRDEMILRFPLSGLRNPDYILTCVQMRTGNWPWDARAWRVLKLE